MIESSGKPPLRLGLAGLGVVGGGVARLLHDNREMIQARTGREIILKTVVDRTMCKPKMGAALTAHCTPSLLDIATDPEIDVVVELIGGATDARTLIRTALENGKHVVTANKKLLAEHGRELFTLAAEKGLHLGFEASVGGGIPIVQTLKETLAANKLHSLMGILNGTANFILSHMSETGMAFDDALKLAQEKGFAEADPTLDIEGIDAAHKLVLTIMLAFGVHFPLEKLRIWGITMVRPMDIAFARELGYTIKLIAGARKVAGAVEAGVYPALIPNHYLLASVTGSFNALRVNGNAGPVMLYGHGAGDLPTASAVLADVMTIARGVPAQNLGFPTSFLPEAEIHDLDEAVSPHYLRIMVPDRPGMLRDIGGVMADFGISLKQVVQKGDDAGGGVPIVFLTHEATATAVHAAMRSLEKMGLPKAPIIHYRIL
ncbi:homoserine dehydrogenase [Megalodesulfovibrio paquesii]